MLMFANWFQWLSPLKSRLPRRQKQRLRRPAALRYYCRCERLETRLTPTGTFTGGASVAVGNLLGDGFNDIVTAAGPGGGPHVKVYSGKTGAIVDSFMAYDINFKGGVSVAIGDVEGNGLPDVITAPGAGSAPEIRIFNPRTGVMVGSFMAYDTSFTGGVSVAAADVDGTGKADIITGPGPGMAPLVKVFTLSGQLVRSFQAYDMGFTGGVNVAAADIEGTGRADIVTGAGTGGGPHVKVFSGPNSTVVRSFFAYDAGFTGGVHVAAAGAGATADIVLGAGAGGGPNVRVYNNSGTLIDSFMAYDTAFRGGVWVAAGDLSGDGGDDVVTGPGQGQAPDVKLFNATNNQKTDFTSYDPVTNPSGAISSPIGGGTTTTGGGPTVTSPIGNTTVNINAAPTTIDLASHFSNPSVTDTVVRFNTVDGNIDVELFNARTPLTVANFLSYLDMGTYDNDIFHRLVHQSTGGLEVLQGGGFTFSSSPSPTITPVTTMAPVKNEPGISNTRGTIAMAKTSQPDSATSQFFFNVQDNTVLDDPNNPQNTGGFTVFGQVRNGLSVMDALAAIPTQSETTFNPAFTDLPLINYTGTNFPHDTTSSNFALTKSIVVEPASVLLNYSVLTNTNSGLVNATVSGNNLTLTYTHGQTGSATITVQATDANGRSVTTSFTVTVR
jgi:cyclophilin family peptidyl-prolyl cis-trans isomerase